jgi:hypothetical protein
VRTHVDTGLDHVVELTKEEGMEAAAVGGGGMGGTY